MPLPIIDALLKQPEFKSFRARREGEPMVFYVNAALDAAGTTPQRLEEILRVLADEVVRPLVRSAQPPREAAPDEGAKEEGPLGIPEPERRDLHTEYDVPTPRK